MVSDDLVISIGLGVMLVLLAVLIILLAVRNSKSSLPADEHVQIVMIPPVQSGDENMEDSRDESPRIRRPRWSDPKLANHEEEVVERYSRQQKTFWKKVMNILHGIRRAQRHQF